jgi:hypothetical protein
MERLGSLEADASNETASPVDGDPGEYEKAAVGEASVTAA